MKNAFSVQIIRNSVFGDVTTLSSSLVPPRKQELSIGELHKIGHNNLCLKKLDLFYIDVRPTPVLQNKSEPKIVCNLDQVFKFYLRHHYPLVRFAVTFMYPYIQELPDKHSVTKESL